MSINQWGVVLSLGTIIPAKLLFSLSNPKKIRFGVLVGVLVVFMKQVFLLITQLTPCSLLRRSEPYLSVSIKMGKIMSDKVWLTDAEVGNRFGSTRQWVWSQARTNPDFPKPIKLSTRWSRWSLQEIVAFEQAAMDRRVN